MSWEAKTDYCGLAGTGIVCKSSTENRQGQYLEKTGADGAICATKPYGTANATPSNDYAIKADAALAFDLGAVTAVDGKKYMLQSVTVSTGSAQEPTLSASAVQVEDAAATGNRFAVSGVTLSPDDIAQKVIDGFTLTGDGCELTQCNAEFSCTVGLSTVNGDPVASDPHTGHIQLSLTILQTGTAAPVVAAAAGWDLSSPLTCSDPDADLPTWTCQVSKPLEKTLATS